MKGKTTQTTSGTRAKGATDFKRLRAMRDADIDFSDIPGSVNPSGRPHGSPCRNPKTASPSELTTTSCSG